MNDIQLKKEWESFSEKPNEKSKNKLVEHYRILVEKIAASLAKKMNNKVSQEELASHGLDGLYNAIDNFDLKRKNKFETYACLRIRGSMIDGLRTEDWVPRSVRIRHNNLEKARSQLEMKKSEHISESEILKEAGIDEAEYHRNVKKFVPTAIASIDNYVAKSDGDFDDAIKDCNKYLQDNCETSPDATIEKQELIKKLLNNNFTKSEKQIVYYYYFKNMTMKEISKITLMSESRISQIHQKVLKRLKKQIQENVGDFEEVLPGVSKMCLAK